MLMVSNFVVLQQRFFFLWRITTSLVFCGFRGDGCGGESGGVFMWCVAGSGGACAGNVVRGGVLDFSLYNFFGVSG